MTLFCTSGQAIFKAGHNVNEKFYSGCNMLKGGMAGDTINYLISGASSTILTLMRNEELGDYATLSANKKEIVNDVCSNMVGIQLVTYDMSGYSSRVEAEDIINVLRDAKLMGLSILRDKKAQDYINGA